MVDTKKGSLKSSCLHAFGLNRRPVLAILLYLLNPIGDFGGRPDDLGVSNPIWFGEASLVFHLVDGRTGQTSARLDLKAAQK